jgi:membrane protein implicated in regulation of membrane protease activity
MEFSPHYFAIALGIVAIIIEVVLGAALGFELLIVGLIFILAGVVGLVTGSYVVSTITVVLLSALYIFFGRGFVKKSLSIATTNTNVDALIGKTAIVVKPIAPHAPGQVKLEGEVWRATADTAFPEGHEVTVKAAEGVTLTVA